MSKVSKTKTDDYNPLRDTNVKMYIIVNKDLKMGTGKIAGQVGHCVAKLTRKLENKKTESYKEWVKTAEAKIILKSTEKQMLELLDKYNCVEVRDAGKTQIPENSLTVIGFEPMRNSEVPDEVIEMKLL